MRRIYLYVRGQKTASFGSTLLTIPYEPSREKSVDRVRMEHGRLSIRSGKPRALLACGALLSGFILCLGLLSGCAGVPAKTSGMPAYSIHGVTYLPLLLLCEQNGINWEYNTFTRTANLSKGGHKINLMAGERLAVIDGTPQHLKYPVEICQGVVVVPSKFEEEILGPLFKDTSSSGKGPMPAQGIKKIVLDAGHGGTDPGTIGRTGLKEKYVNLDIAKRLAVLLRSEGVEVIMTRSTDRFLPLSARVDIANNSRADLFISIHANANRVRSLRGFEVYYISPAVSDSQRALSSAQNATLDLEGAYLDNQNLDLKATLWDMIYTYNRAESVELAYSICQAAKYNLDTMVLGTKSANFYVLRNVRMPAVLIEVGFLSNYNEERIIKNGYYRQQIAEGIFDGLNRYIDDYIS